MNPPLVVRTKFSYALKMSIGIILFAVVVVYIGILNKDIPFNPIYLTIYMIFYSVYLVKALRDKADALKLQITLSTVTVFVMLLITALFGWLGLATIAGAFFGIGGAYYIIVKLIDRDPVIIADDEKLQIYNGLFNGKNFVVRWDQIAGLKIVEQNVMGNKYKYLMVNLLNAEQFTRDNPSKMLAKYIYYNNNTLGGHLAADASHIEIDDQDLLNRLQMYMKQQPVREVYVGSVQA